MAHLTPEIHEGEYYTVEIDGETTVFTYFCYAKDHIEESFSDAEEVTITVAKHTGVIGRLSASGYLDCTDWQEYESLADAKAELFDETDGYAVFKLPARFASALINDDWSSSELTKWDNLSLGKFSDDENVICFIDIIDDEPYYSWWNDLNSEGDEVVRYLARIDESATV